jgi:hypothetical protein
VGFFLGYRFLNPWGLAYGFLFDEMIQNNQKSIQKSIYLPVDFKNLKENQTKPKVSRLLSNVCNFQKVRTLGKKTIP